MRGAWVGVLPLLLSGCFVPPGVAVASYAADGASYATTGKSITDHGVSTVKNEDCATYRVFVGGTICKDPKHPDPAAPLVQHGGGSPALPATAAKPTSSGVIAAATPPAEVGPRPAAPPAAIEALPVAAPIAHYFSVGTFADRRRAELYARRYAAYNPQLLSTRLAGHDLVRVVLGPLDDGQMTYLHGHGIGGYEVPTPVPEVPAVAQSPKIATPG
jgi:hypothetical protein